MKNNGRMIVLVLLCSFWMLGIQVNAQEQEAIQKRVEQAERLGLQDWIDEEGYLIDRYYAGKSDAELSELSIDGLVRTLSEEEVDAYVSNLKQGISFFTVTYYQKVSQLNPDTGRLLYTGLFEVDGVLAYCIQRSVSTPAKGSATGTPVEVTNENVRKVLYYGYNGPKAQGYTYVETALAAGEANGDGDNSLGRKVLAEIKTKAATPSNFKVWKVSTNGGKTQDLAYYTLDEKGSVQVKKISANPELTDDKPAYSLKGAVFGVYSDAACKVELGRLTTDANGNSETLKMEAGTYFLKELTAPSGYLANLETVTVTVEEGKAVVVTIANEPRENMGFQLPNTGCFEVIFIEALGTACLGMGYVKRKGGLYE